MTEELDLEVIGPSLFYGDVKFGSTLSVEGTISMENVLVSGLVSNFNTTQSTSTDTGSVVLSGGLGMMKNLWIGGSLNVVGGSSLLGGLSISGDSESVSIHTGCATFAGGIGVGKSVNVGKSLGIEGSLQVILDASVGGTLVCSKTSGNGLEVAGSAHVVGAVRASSFVSTSDRRLKRNIESLNAAECSKRIGSLRPCCFEWKDSAMGIGQVHGLIAQEVRDVMPQAVREDDVGRLSIEYSAIISQLIKTVQHLSNKVENLESEKKSSYS